MPAARSAARRPRPARFPTQQPGHVRRRARVTKGCLPGAHGFTATARDRTVPPASDGAPPRPCWDTGRPIAVVGPTFVRRLPVGSRSARLSRPRSGRRCGHPDRPGRSSRRCRGPWPGRRAPSSIRRASVSASVSVARSMRPAGRADDDHGGGAKRLTRSKPRVMPSGSCQVHRIGGLVQHLVAGRLLVEGGQPGGVGSAEGDRRDGDLDHVPRVRTSRAHVLNKREAGVMDMLDGPARAVRARSSALPQAASTTFAKEHPPCVELAGVVQGYWIVRWDRRGLAPFTQKVLPSPSVNLTLKRGPAPGSQE